MDKTWLLLLNPVILAALAASTHQLHHIVGFVHLFSLYQTVKNKNSNSVCVRDASVDEETSVRA